MNKKRLPAILALCATTAFLAVIAFLLLRYESTVLFCAQELSLFLYTKSFFQHCMTMPGGLLSYLGTYFTQYFYEPAAGVAWLCAWWALVVGLTQYAFRIPARWIVLSFIPVAMLLSINVSLGYWIFFLKLRGFLFAATIGTACAIGLAGLFRHLTASRFHADTVFLALTVVLGYLLLGGYALFTALLMLVFSWQQQSHSKAIANSAIGIALSVVIPLLCYRYVYHETHIDDIFRVGFPRYEYIDVADSRLYIPFAVLGIFLLILPFLSSRLSRKPVKTPVWALASVVMLALSGVFVWKSWFKDDNFHRELEMRHCIENLQWEKVLDLAAEETDEPTRALVMMKNLALFRLGRQSDDMCNYRNGSKKHNSVIDINLAQTFGSMLYFHYGRENYCHRWCFENGVEYGWRIENYIYLAKSSLLNGEVKLAKKYLGIMKHTKFYREWAEKYEVMANAPKKMAEDEEFSQIIPMMDYDNELNVDDEMAEMYLMRNYIFNEQKNIKTKEMAVLACLQMHDMQNFWPCFFAYAEALGDQHMPRLFQEAAYMFGQYKGSGIDTSTMPFDQSVKDTFDQFMRIYGQYDNLPPERLVPVLSPQFGHTYYYDYFIFRDITTY